MKTSPFNFTGKGSEFLRNDSPGIRLPPYLLSHEAVESVKRALYLQRPLLLTGERGSGKTLLAKAVASELGLNYLLWQLKSTSRVKDSLYFYDEHSHHQVGLRNFDSPPPTEDYISLGPLGTAFSAESPSLILIENLEKVNTDFHEELLLTLDEQEFYIKETNRYVRSKQRLIIIATADDRDGIADMFFNNCVHCKMEFPDKESINRILHMNFPTAGMELIGQMVNAFMLIRSEIAQSDRFKKNLTIGQLQDWLRLLLLDNEQDALIKVKEARTYFKDFLPRTDMINKITNKRPLRVFLCHSSNDKQTVRILYQKLLSQGFDPWLDEEKLLPGQDWAREITKAVKATDVVVACLSSTSINKKGYIQKELKYALDVADEQPEDAVFMIPLKLDQCELPERLARWQWVQYFDSDGFEKLFKTLKILEHSIPHQEQEER